MNKVGIGMCFHDDAGDFVLAKKSWFSPLCDVNIGEVVGLHTILKWTSHLQFDNVDLALDSKKVVDAFRRCVGDSSEFGCIIVECRQLFQSRFQNSHVEFNRRQANGITYELAHIAPHNARSLTYDDVPSFI
uniref:Polynucleotidyl transferase, Ribonuclease H fold n=1 Tax=Medicago truncatula TaxID=3880 RepID=A2Q4Z3_MEDTR|nr:Polynucleotidyl transferase, Ribonuclease H fold [Medicago truncatula]